MRKTILAAAEEASQRLNDLAPSLAVSPPAGDQISQRAAAVWTANLLGNPDSHFHRLQQYVDNVLALGEQLGEAAKHYGYTDEEISASFQSKRSTR
ncbi:hypothetical protein EIL87_14445 [Saccharopolyspora rhizosphaerae]|uniref:PE domain-containing protein n=1 Tax=Saccharopolyspora rhizosphaerae TaxID=2492662 RepID=A0A3R8NZ37_9PSEU|nr:hypothetical protein EIL87_14445 [Saccharopolyspora rhizosphaerae]